MKYIFIVFLFGAPDLLSAAALLPSAEGTTWQYESVDDASAGARSEVTVRIAGNEIFEGKTLLRFETRTDGEFVKAELIALDGNAIVCHARSDKDGKLLKLDPPEVMVPANRAIGATWEVDDQVADMRTRQRFAVAGEENIGVPAGNFRALRFHCGGAGLLSFTIDRWFVAGTGFVKEATIIRGPSGSVIQRIVRELKKTPEITVAPATPTPTPAAIPPPTVEEKSKSDVVESSGASPEKGLLSVEISSDPAAGSQTEFRSDVPKLYVRWKGQGLPKEARVRVVWIAEDVGGLVEPNFVVDESETVAASPDASARFTLARPEDGWAEGKYRLDVYLNDEIAETLRVQIVK